MVASSGCWWRGTVPCIAAAILFLLSVLSPAFGQSGPFTGVLTYHNDNLRTGQNLAETILTPSNVNLAQFGQLFTANVDGEIYAQPLYVPAVAIPGKGTHNVVIVATENDTVYAFDADTAGPPLWQISLLSNGATAIPSTDITNCFDLTPLIGSTSTGVIDPATNTLFLTAATKEADASYVYRLHALDITTGTEQPTSPAVIQGSLPSTGPNASGGKISLSALLNNQRSALLLDNGVVYMAFSSHCDTDPYNGFVLGYNEASLSQVALYSDAPNGTEAGIWMSGGGLATDASGDIYLSTGNGTFDANVVGGLDYGDSFMRLTPAGSGFTVNSFFTPSDQATLSEEDKDLGSGAMLLLPDQPAPPTHLALSMGKEGLLYLVNRDDMGGYQMGAAGADNVVQEIPGFQGLFSTPAYFNNNVYMIPAGGAPVQLSLSNGKLSSTPVATFPVGFNFNGATPSISANGASNGILWMIRNANNTAVLYALDASNINTELYDSSQNAARDTAGTFNKFQVPTVANGKVYVGTQTRLAVYGLFVSPTPTPAPTPTPTATPMPTPTPANVVIVTHMATGTARPGESRSGGTFMLTNSSGAAETISSVTVTFSNAAMFKSAALHATQASASRSAKAKPPEPRTTFTFKSPLALPATKNATFRLNLTAIKGATAPSDQAVTGIATSRPAIQGLPANLGAVSPPSK